jgi:uncharacterized protein YcbX
MDEDPGLGALLASRPQEPAVSGVIESIWRYPVKGFTPEPLVQAALSAGAHMPFDRLYAVEDGPSGFDPAAPQHISKQKFTVLAKLPQVAKIRTAYDEAAGVLTAEAPGHGAFAGALTSEPGRARFAIWLTAVLGEAASGPLRVLPAPPAHRFMDDVEGFVSVINLASIRALEAALGAPVDPRRFRANLYVEGWPPWSEHALAGRAFTVGEVELVGAKPIRRCLATHVDPETGERDLEVVSGLFEAFGHQNCGLYASVTRGGVVRRGDAARAPA